MSADDATPPGQSEPALPVSGPHSEHPRGMRENGDESLWTKTGWFADLVSRQELAFTEETIPAHSRTNFLCQTNGARKDQAGHQGARTGNERGEGAGAQQENTSHQGSSKGQGGEGKI